MFEPMNPAAAGDEDDAPAHDLPPSVMRAIAAVVE